MSVISPALLRGRRAFDTVAHSPTALWSAFILTHLWLGFLNLTAPGEPLGDVDNQYKYWTEQADLATFYVGIDKSWVYPIVALVPMIIAGVFGFADYAGTWLSLVLVLDMIAFAADRVAPLRSAGGGSRSCSCLGRLRSVASTRSRCRSPLLPFSCLPRGPVLPRFS
jgi:hypothetical protein